MPQFLFYFNSTRTWINTESVRISNGDPRGSMCDFDERPNRGEQFPTNWCHPHSQCSQPASELRDSQIGRRPRTDNSDEERTTTTVRTQSTRPLIERRVPRTTRRPKYWNEETTFLIELVMVRGRGIGGRRPPDNTVFARLFLSLKLGCFALSLPLWKVIIKTSHQFQSNVGKESSHSGVLIIVVWIEKASLDHYNWMYRTSDTLAGVGKEKLVGTFGSKLWLIIYPSIHFCRIQSMLCTFEQSRWLQKLQFVTVAISWKGNKIPNWRRQFFFPQSLFPFNWIQPRINGTQRKSVVLNPSLLLHLLSENSTNSWIFANIFEIQPWENIVSCLWIRFGCFVFLPRKTRNRPVD